LGGLSLSLNDLLCFFALFKVIQGAIVDWPQTSGVPK
jgi:hypothetical protein